MGHFQFEANWRIYIKWWLDILIAFSARLSRQKRCNVLRPPGQEYVSDTEERNGEACSWALSNSIRFWAFRSFYARGVHGTCLGPLGWLFNAERRLPFLSSRPGPGNIIVSDDGNILGILHWESAGYYSDFWIATKPSVSPDLDFLSLSSRLWRFRAEKTLEDGAWNVGITASLGLVHEMGSKSDRGLESKAWWSKAKAQGIWNRHRTLIWSKEASLHIKFEAEKSVEWRTRKAIVSNTDHRMWSVWW